ncbi:hypothetical protein BDY21DRAFT_386143 [Lineolata rhizophorae]|uniref:Uncharacterized protein n=1 Tax=Lineolata rhizophorae TaxID=578093 RepID=A0A6A6NZN0_9PEZI|nr:hypothetical protein BDY21DRAFT_386143 [Lineolata rhizophorae]
MSSVSRIVAALISGSQETNVALANLNFDFSLVKVEAPPEFHGLGAALSQGRRASAESGSSHVTARKLGALFEQILPKTPNLFERYGTRVSEIAQGSEPNPASNRLGGLFADQVGMDGTSIWAAATSGKESIAVHLLACMLARMWTGPEATSIWAELVEERKRELSNMDPAELLHLPTLAAAQVTVSREQLSEWDNSARAWLRTADEAKRNTYKSVMDAWKLALTSMENIVSGIPQSVRNGSLLLGLASWHLFPDMNVMGSKHIAQKDSLVPAEAILTVGLQNSPSHEDVGVYWSLPLAHYRSYGHPPISSRSLCGDTE